MSTLCQAREHGQICIRMAYHEGDHQWAPDTSLTEPEFDADGYPTDATLETLRHWPLESASAGLAFVARAWKYSDYVGNELRPHEAETIMAVRDRKYWRFATGGWSGNEELMSAFMESQAAGFVWCLHARGGLWIFQEPIKVPV